MFKNLIYAGVITITALLLAITPAFSSNVYYMIGRIDTKQADKFQQFMREKESINPTNNRILLVIKGDGGEAPSRERIMKMINSSTVPVDTFALNRLQSANANIFLFGENRYNVNATLSYHQTGCTPSEPTSCTKAKIFTGSLKIYIKEKTRLNESVVEYLFKPNNYLTTVSAKQAFDLGLSTSKDIPDMSIYETKE